MKTIAKHEMEKKLKVKITDKEFEYLSNQIYNDSRIYLRLLCNYRYKLLQNAENKILDIYSKLTVIIQKDVTLY